MSLFLRDPFWRDPYYEVRRPVRVHRVPTLTDQMIPLLSSRSFDRALGELQTVMDDVNAVIGDYQSGIGRDLVAGEMKTTRTEDGNLQMAIDCSQYKPEEISVKLCDDNLVVEAKTERSENDSYHKSEFKRWLKLPADCKHEAIKTTLTPDKKLVIDVPMLKPIADSRSRTIPIDVQTKPAVESGQAQDAGDKKEEAKGQK